MLAKQLTSAIAEAGYAVDHAADGERTTESISCLVCCLWPDLKREVIANNRLPAVEVDADC